MYEDLEQREIEYVRGKVAGNVVSDSSGNPIVTRGQAITDEAISKAKSSGQLHYLMIAAATTALAPGSPDLGRRLQEFRDVTEDHEAEFVLGRMTGKDVRDFQGNIIVKRGDVVGDQQIRQAETQGALQELVLAVGAAGLSLEAEAEEEEELASEIVGSPESC